jgi:AcrR family transcriptional regulator
VTSPVARAEATTAAPGRRRGRPRASGRATELDARDEILRAAATLFSTRGIGATRVTDIAAAVGVTPPSIYYHFDNLDAIVGTLLDYVIVESSAFATSVRSRPGDAAQRLHALIAQHVERLTRGPFDLWFVAGLSEQDAKRFPGVGRRAHAWRRAVADLVAEGSASGTFAPIAPDVAVSAVSGLVYGALELSHRGRTVDPEQTATLAVRALT